MRYKIKSYIEENFNEPEKYQAVNYGKIENLSLESINAQLKAGVISPYWAQYDRAAVRNGAYYKLSHKFRYPKFNLYHNSSERILYNDVFYFNKNFDVVDRLLFDK